MKGQSHGRQEETQASAAETRLLVRPLAKATLYALAEAEIGPAARNLQCVLDWRRGVVLRS